MKVQLAKNLNLTSSFFPSRRRQRRPRPRLTARAMPRPTLRWSMLFLMRSTWTRRKTLESFVFHFVFCCRFSIIPTAGCYQDIILDQIVLERSARWSCSMFCVLWERLRELRVWIRKRISLESEKEWGEVAWIFVADDGTTDGTGREPEVF